VRASPDERWIPAKRVLFPVWGLSVVIRGEYLEAQQLDFAGETTAPALPRYDPI
jgi:hypothetical protein